jgi:Zn-dependent peptidase ImmA (M78 family)
MIKNNSPLSFAKPVNAAQSLVSKYCIERPNEFSIVDIIYAEGLFIDEKPLQNCEGRIIIEGGSALIVINSNIDYEGRKRFVLAHELGHFVLHKNLQTLFHCKSSDFLDFHSTGSHETEANFFAAEILMPTSIFKNYCSKKIFDFNLIQSISKDFGTSFTSSLIRFTEIGHTPICIFYCQNGRIVWFKKSHNFSVFNVKNKCVVAKDSLASAYFKNINAFNEPSPKIVLKDTWFNDSFLRSDSYFNEYCFPIKKLNTCISIVWTAQLGV